MQTTAKPSNPTKKQTPTLAAFLKTAMADTPKQGTAKAGRPKGTTTKAANGAKSTQFKVPERNRRGPNTKKSRSWPKLMVDHKVKREKIMNRQNKDNNDANFAMRALL